MPTYQPPSPPLQSSKGTCYQCKHFLGLTAKSPAGRCGRPGEEHLVARPEFGCAWWEEHPKRDKSIRTVQAWEAAHGRPLAEFDDFLKRRSWPLPLDGRRIRMAYDADPSPPSRALAWEIARLHDVLLRTHNAINAITQSMPHCDARSDLLRLAELLRREPGIVAATERKGKNR